MISDKVIIKQGSFLSSSNIEEKEDCWEFINQDPQIYIQFENPVRGISIEVFGESAELIENAIVYYRTNDEVYSEELTYKYRLDLSKRTVHEIHFFKEINEIRFDISNENHTVNIEKIIISPLKGDETAVTCLSKNINNYSNGEKVLVLTHDLSKSGAPILAYNIANTLKKQGYQVAVLSGGNQSGFLKDKYMNSNIPLLILDESSANYANCGFCIDKGIVKTYDDKEYHAIVFETLRDLGYKNIITNTIVSGKYVELLKGYDFKIISLIHEMKTSVKLYNMLEYGRHIQNHSDYLVFADEIVFDNYNSLYKKIYGEAIIRPQGIYLREAKVESTQSNDNLFEIDLSKKIILSSGTCELRKGIDLFLQAAIVLSRIRDDVEFVWTGNFGNNKELQGWIEMQIALSGLSNRFHIIPFIEDQDKYIMLLKNTDVFWSTSREDPFPSVVLEAMDLNIPVVGFKNSGGVNTMLDNNQGFLIDLFDTNELANVTDKVLKGKLRTNKSNIKQFLDALNFNDYCEFLKALLKKKQIVNPDLNLYIWKNSKKLHYFQLQMPSLSIGEKEEQLAKAIEKQSRKINKYIYKKDIVLLDTAIGSDNVGDDIIMDYCYNVCRDIFKTETFIHIPTHIYDSKSESINKNFKILCGTNIIYKRMEDSRQFALPADLSNMTNICLLGVGMQQIGLGQEVSEYTKKMLKFMLSDKFIHSVRDQQTKEFLEQIGINNVINTGCPTLWKLTPEHCNEIPTKKADVVLTTVTDYMPDVIQDKLMLDILSKNYSKVYIWIQGQYDYEYLRQFVDLKNYVLIPPNLEALDEVLKQDNLDYVGTRLHAGIRSLNNKHRSLIITIDNRARAIGKDTNLPVLERDCIEEVEKWIYSNQKTEITLPFDKIDEWKKQFKFSIPLIKTKI